MKEEKSVQERRKRSGVIIAQCKVDQTSALDRRRREETWIRRDVINTK